MANLKTKKMPDDDAKDDSLDPSDDTLDGDIENEDDEDLDSWELEEDLEE